jgi:phosphoribosylanthranilate isomerase
MPESQKCIGESVACRPPVDPVLYGSVFIKICGLTDPVNAAACVKAGADIIGLVFYPKSPRHLSLGMACKVAGALPDYVPVWGIFVNAAFDSIMATVTACRLSGVQLHGTEPPELVNALKKQNLTVIKTLFIHRTPGLDCIDTYRAADFLLVECGSGTLPGGNAKTWDYSRAKNTAARHPVILAGGLSPENIRQAVTHAGPAGVDMSSGVELSPGIKDITKVTNLVRQIRQPFLTPEPH